MFAGAYDGFGLASQYARRGATQQTVYCWQPCPSSCRSSSLEESPRGRRLIVITADFLLSFIN